MGALHNCISAWECQPRRHWSQWSCDCVLITRVMAGWWSQQRLIILISLLTLLSSSVSTPRSKWITLSDSWPIIDPSWWITQPWGRENWVLRDWPGPVNIKWRCLQSVQTLHNGPQCDIVPAQTRGWHLEFFTIPPLRPCDNNPELLPAPACVIHNGRRKFVFSSIQGCCQNVQLWNLVLCVHFVQLSVSDGGQKAGWCCDKQTISCSLQLYLSMTLTSEAAVPCGLPGHKNI